MNCFSSRDHVKRHSKCLDKNISTWMHEYEKTIKFLLLGAGESGKTTILKQMKILHIDGFSKEEKQEKAAEIRWNILDAIKALICNMMQLKPPEPLADPGNQISFNYIQDISMTDEYDYPQEFYEHVIRLWADAGVQRCFFRNHEYPLIDSAKYFLEKVHIVRQSDYVPTDQDILHSRKRTSEIQKIEFKEKIPKKYGGGMQTFWMFDVGGQRGERRKWIQVFDGITAVLFLVASSGFDLKIREDHETNRLGESFALFKDVWRSRFLRESGFILFLNKQDILEEKVKRGVSIKDYFPEYDTYVFPNLDGAEEYVKVRCFIRDMFLEETKKPDPEVRPRDGSDLYRRGSKPRDCYSHFTTATDTKNVKRVFDDIHTMIIMQNLECIAPS